MPERSPAPPLSGAYRDVLEQRLRGAGSTRARDLFGDVEDDFWFWLHTDGYREEPRLAGLLAGMPPEAFQRNFTGTADDAALRLAFDFYRLVRRLVDRHAGARIDSALDFGCGWGRVLRFFMRDVDPDRLWGIDCLPEAVEMCRATNPHCRFELIAPWPPSPLAAESFDLIWAYSVFSHLSEPVHLAWIAEFQRLLRPGGLVVATTRPRDFVHYTAYLRTQPNLPSWAWAAKAFVDVDECLARYDRGEFLYDPLGAGLILDGSVFGETCIPRAYVERVWTERFELVDYIADPHVCEQNVIVVRKPR